MKLIIVIVSITSIVLSELTDEEVREKWNHFKLVYKKNYINKVDDTVRLNIFRQNLNKINEHNGLYENGLASYQMGINQFADLTVDEFKLLNGLKSFHPPNMDDRHIVPLTFLSTSTLPTEIDWRKRGAVTDVKDQGGCGSCWSFSATGALEGQYFRKHGQLVSLSEQNLVDCSLDYGNYGCGGGWMDAAFRYVIDFGITSEKDYPYEGADDVCRYSKRLSVMRAQNYSDILYGDENNLQSAVANVGPVAVAVDANMWQFYSKGIFYDRTCNSMTLNHGVLAVGYGVENGTNYWIVKNSWGRKWGEDGYIKLIKNINNHCGVASYASYPIL